MNKYYGKYCSGEGDTEWLKLIDDSLSMLSPTPYLPNLSMVYNPKKDSLKEGFIWGNGWWIQNSYGFGITSPLFLDKTWFDALQHGMDMFWENIGDGKHYGSKEGYSDKHNYALNLIAPDGCLGDCVDDYGIYFRQGDGHVELYDWFYEATAAGVNMQAEFVLCSHDTEAAQKYLSLMLRSSDFIENSRDENGLFLVGPSCNLLAPSFGAAYNKGKNEFEKSYLTGLCITYTNALKRLIEVAKLADDFEKEKLFTERYNKNITALPQLLTDEGYFAKSMEKDGTKHGVYGAPMYGYLEGVCNADAIAFGVVGDDICQSIYKKIANVAGIRKYDFLLNNFPHLDDTYMNYMNDTSAPNALGWWSGDWVDGGAWATVEGRAVLGYMRLKKHEDAKKSCGRYMRWAEDFRQDAPMSQWGANSHNPWQGESADFKFGDKNTPDNPNHKPVSVMIDNFAPVSGILAGLFGTEAVSNGIIINPSIPVEIEYFISRKPIIFGKKKIYVEVLNGETAKHVYLNSVLLKTNENGGVHIPYNLLQDENKLFFDCKNVGYNDQTDKEYEFEYLSSEDDIDMNLLPENLLEKYNELLKNDSGEYEEYKKEAVNAFKAAAKRRTVPFDKENFRPMTERKKSLIVNLFDEAALNMYEGLKLKIQK